MPVSAPGMTTWPRREAGESCQNVDTDARSQHGKSVPCRQAFGSLSFAIHRVINTITSADFIADDGQQSLTEAKTR